MGLSYEFLVYSNGGTVDLQNSSGGADPDALLRTLYPRTPYRRVGEIGLLNGCRQPRGRLAVGTYGDGVLIVTKDAHLYDPDILNRRYFKIDGWTDLQLLTSESHRDMFAYGHWRSGELRRCISVNATAGVWRDHGVAESFEGSAVVHANRWLDLSNAALASILRLPGDVARRFQDPVDWNDVTLSVFARVGE